MKKSNQQAKNHQGEECMIPNFGWDKRHLSSENSGQDDGNKAGHCHDKENP